MTFPGMKSRLSDRFWPECSGQRSYFTLPGSGLFGFIFRIVNCTDVGVYELFQFHARVGTFESNEDVRDKGSQNHNTFS